jgi:DNA adenine methylase
VAQRGSLVRPYLKWAGGKRQLLGEIKKHIPQPIAKYYEPFLGAGAVLFALQPARAVINDSNSQLMLTYRSVRDSVDELLELLLEHQRRNSKEYYYSVRALDRDGDAFALLTDLQKAARLIYLNKTCYNGLYRVNAQGLFNVPYGRYKTPAICQEPVIRAVSSYLNSAGVDILCGDYRAAVLDADAESFVYFDPPYHSPDNINFTGYSAGGFGEAEQERLRDTFAELTERGVRCLLSNSDTPFIRDLYRRYEIRTLTASRAINSNAAGRGGANEVLIRNW